MIVKQEESEDQASPALLPLLAVFLIGAGLFVYFWFLALVPLGSPDTWFHLKNGQYILETHTLPGPEDPYGFTLEGQRLEGSSLQGLRSQWLGQVVLYAVFENFGPSGLSALRATLVLLPFVLVFAWGSRRKGWSFGSSSGLAVVSAPVFLTSMFFTVSYERPQALSFAFACVVLLVLHRLRRGDASIWWHLALPALMPLWSNMHGGYIVGVSLIALWATGELVTLLAHRYGVTLAGYLGQPLERPAWFFGASAAGLLAAGLHPGWYLQVQWALSLLGGQMLQGERALAGSATVMSQVLEYKPLMYIYQSLGLKWPLFILAYYMISLAVIATASWFKKRIMLPVVLVAVFVVWFGTAYFRGVLFALPVLAFCVTWSLDGLGGWRRAAPAAAMALLLVSMLAYYGTEQPWRFDPRPPSTWISGEYPEGAVRFMREHDVKGPLFNYLGWGGYLIWSAWPDYRVFIDGRELDSEAFARYVEILEGSPGWRETLDSYGINTIMVPALSDKNGAVFPILSMMAWEGDDIWVPVYIRNNTVLLVRDDPVNAEVIGCCALSKRRLYSYIADYAALMLISAPRHPVLLESRAAGLFWSGRAREARQALAGLPDGSSMKRTLMEKLRNPAEKK